MVRAALPLLAVLAACGVDLDDRPRSLEYVTQAVLAPSCGNAQCHSQLRQAADLAFDTVENARLSIERQPGMVNVGDPLASKLYFVLVREDRRMPLDQPMPERNIGLIVAWIEDGAVGVNVGQNP